MANQIVFDNKARIALDTLQPEERKKVSDVIYSLVNFPDPSCLLDKNIAKLKNLNDYFMARAGNQYRVFFRYQEPEVIITDIIHRDTLHALKAM
ncbi:hypothetical protein V0288_03420 [Pannus brasiliensis CCIBt3594]|uniref:Type II toxin-antitoxin system RelE/ParE family toxin n=1 Tax=Pannus brasiliensis CCIBt3594 TaxID=1427578 RepID=A0AAW9QRQ2_9CHRO